MTAETRWQRQDGRDETAVPLGRRGQEPNSTPTVIHHLAHKYLRAEAQFPKAGGEPEADFFPLWTEK